MKCSISKNLGLLLVAILAFGCTAEEPATTGTAAETPAVMDEDRVPPCSWITEAEATEALGQPSRYRSATDDGSSNCIIDPAEGDTGISVDFKVTDDVDAWEAESVGMPTISDLGNIAVWSGSTIAVKKGDHYLIAHLSSMGPAQDLRAPAIAFARAIVDKM